MNDPQNYSQVRPAARQSHAPHRSSHAPRPRGLRAKAKPGGTEQFAELIARLEQRFDQFAAIPRPAEPNTSRCRPLSTARSPKSTCAAARSAAREARRRTLRSRQPLQRRRRTCPASKTNYARSPTRSRHCGVPASRKRSMHCAPSSARSAARSTRRCRGGPSTPSRGRSRTQPAHRGRPPGRRRQRRTRRHRAGLAEVRDALRDLTPAENLVGYQRRGRPRWRTR